MKQSNIYWFEGDVVHVDVSTPTLTGVMKLDKADWPRFGEYGRITACRVGRSLYATLHIATHVMTRVHRLLNPDWPLTDHIDGDGLNNCRSNLRVADRQQNRFNETPLVRSKGRHLKGVQWVNNRWVARIMHDGVYHYGGCYRTEVEAAMAYDRMARQYFGDRARCNFPDNPRVEVHHAATLA